MVKYKCTKCGNISDTLTGFNDATVYDEYRIDEFGELHWVAELDGLFQYGEVMFECSECGDTTIDYNEFERVYNDG